MIYEKDGRQVGQSFSHHGVVRGIVGGMYFYRLQAGDPSHRSGQWFVETKKLMLSK